jgi:glutathione synthase/RimK-type ligase-like ATP-grasp enzyme
MAGPGWRFDLEELTGVYARHFGAEGRVPLPGVAPDLLPGIYAEGEAVLAALLEDLPCTVANRYGSGISNNSKPLQALLIEQCGLKAPETLVTNDPEQAQAFFDECSGDVIYKSLSGIRSIVRRLLPEQLGRLALLRQGPAQFQRFVPGDNVRVHVVGERIFATRVYSDAVDYRYARKEGLSCEMVEEVLAPEIEEACIGLAQRLDLTLAGVDLKITPEGEVFCFEVNPSPAFSFYEIGTGQPISAALADLLHAAPRDLRAAGSHPQLAETQ